MIQRLLQLWDQWKRAPNAQQADALLRQILQLAADAFEVIGLTRGTTVFGVRTDRLKNVPAKIPMGWEYPDPTAPTLPQQYWIAQS